MRNQQLFDNLQIYDTVLQLMTFLWAADDASNTDIIEELQKQNSKYLETIIRQNKKSACWKRKVPYLHLSSLAKITKRGRRGKFIPFLHWKGDKEYG